MEELSSWFGHVFTPDEFPVLMLHIKKVKQSRYTPWRRLGGEEV
jgi:hypothetical protein